MLKNIIALVIFYFFIITSSSAATIQAGKYQLWDHPDGNKSSYGSYGLRLDHLKKYKKGWLFSVEKYGAAAYIAWNGKDGKDGKAAIYGKIYNHLKGKLWDVKHTFYGIKKLAGGKGFISTGGWLTLTDPYNNEYKFKSKQNSYGIGTKFAADYHRCKGHPNCGPYVARGWLKKKYGTTYGTNDWLVQTKPIPIPAALPLFIGGLGMLIMFRRKYG
ncbi:MAG: VPLPA-CTERM sorting domain-containing protein [Thermodesulfobacteriota bacterium]